MPRDLALGRMAAVKVLSDSLTAEARARLLREAEACARLQHPAIATFFEAGEFDGTAFLAMEFVAGETLRDRLRRGPLPFPHAGPRARARGRSPPPRHQAGERHGDRRQPRQAARLRDRAAAGRAGRERSRDRSGVDGSRRRDRHARLHVAGAAPGPAARRAVGPLLAGRRLLRSPGGAARLSRRDPRGSDRGDPCDRLRAAACNGRRSRYGSRADPGSRPRPAAAVSLGGRLPLRSEGARVRRAHGVPSVFAGDPGFSLARRQRRLDRQRIRREPRRRPRAASRSLAHAAPETGPGSDADGRRGTRGRVAAGLPLGVLGSLSAHREPPARHGAARRRRDGRDRGVREARRRSRRHVRNPGPAFGFGHGEAASRRRVSDCPARSPHRRLRAPRARTPFLPSPREGNSRPGARSLRGSGRRRLRVRSRPGRARGGSRDAISLRDGSARARDRRELRAPGDRGRFRAGRAAPLARILPVAAGTSGRGVRAGTPGHGAGPRERLRSLLRRLLSRPDRETGREPSPVPAGGRARPRHGFAWLALGWTHLELCSHAEARWCLEKCLALEGEVGVGPTAGVGGYLGECLRRSGDLSGARAACLRGLEAVERSDFMYRDTFRGVCLCALGRTALDQGDAAAAHAAFTQAVAHLRGRVRALGGGHLLVQALAGLARSGQEGSFAEALALFSGRRGHDFSMMWSCTDESLLELARAAESAGRSEAAELFQKARAAGSQEALGASAP